MPYFSEKPTGRPGFPDLPESHTTRPASASEPWVSAWNQEVRASRPSLPPARIRTPRDESAEFGRDRDRKSTRLNSSHLGISYAVFCLKKKQTKTMELARLSRVTRTMFNHTHARVA